MAKKVNKTVLIGLGGTGQAVLLRVKKSLLKNFGEVPPMVKLMAFDTTNPDSLDGEFSYTDPQGAPVTAEKVSFNRSEFLKIPVNDVNELKKAPRVKEWLNASVSRQIVPSADGAKQFRPQGRFSFFYNYAKEGLNDQISQILNHINDAGLTRSDRYEVMNDATHSESIHLLFSPAGGTGSGTFLDFANLIKSGHPQVKLTAHVLLPDFFKIYGSTDRIYANAYGALKEIDYLMDVEGEDDQGGDVLKNPWKVNYDGSGAVSFLSDESGDEEVAARLFDSVFLYDNINSNRKVWDITDMRELMGRVFYQFVSGPGKVIEDAFNNLTDYNHRSNEQTGKKRRHYQALGYAELVLDKSFLKDLKKLIVARALIFEYKKQASSAPGVADFESLIDVNSLRENNGKDQVIDQLLPTQQFAFNSDAILEGIKYERGAGDSLNRNCLRLIDTEKSRANSLAQGNSELLLRRASEFINNQVGTYLNQQGGLHVCKSFLNHLTGSFQAMKNEMTSEALAHDKAAQNLTSSLGEYLNLIKEAEDGFIPIGRASKIEAKCVEYMAQIKNLIYLNHNKSRKEVASTFYSQLLTIVQTLADDVDEITKVFNNAEVSLVDKIHNMQNVELPKYDFEILLHEKFRSDIDVESNEVELSNALENLDFARLKTVRSVEQLLNFFSPYIELLSAYQNMDNLTADSVMREIHENDPREFANIIKFLDSNSAVNCNYTETFATGDTGMPKMSNMHYLFTVQQEEGTIVKESFFEEHLSKSYRMQPVITGDPDKIGLIKIEGAFIANVVDRIADWKRDYNRKKPVNFHIDASFVDAPDLFKDSSAKDALLYFGIGSALGIIACEANTGYHIKLKGKKKPLYEKGAKNKTNRNLAYDYFKKHEEYSDYLRKGFETERKEDPMLTKDLLLKHFKTILDRDVLKKAESSLTDEERDFIANERMEVANYCLNDGITKVHEYESLGFKTRELRDLGLEI